MIKWLKRWWWGGYEHSPKEQLAFVAGYEAGKKRAEMAVLDFVDSHPLISARWNDGFWEVVHHSEKHFKDEFDWDASPRTNALERHDARTYH